MHPYSKAIVLKVVCPLTELRNLRDGFGAGRYLMGRKGQSDEGFWKALWRYAFRLLVGSHRMDKMVSGFIHKGKSVGRVITDSKVVISDNAGKQLIEVMELMGISWVQHIWHENLRSCEEMKFKTSFFAAPLFFCEIIMQLLKKHTFPLNIVQSKHLFRPTRLAPT